MQTLFPIEPFYPAGFSYEADFISTGEEATLLNSIEQATFHSFQFQGYVAKRKIASYGMDWSFENQRLTRGKDIPAEYHWLIDRVAAKLSLPPSSFAALLLTEYPVGSVINWHRDAPPFELIVGISLGSNCLFKLRPYEKEKQGRKALFSIPVKRRSLYVMEGEARNDWQHSTAPVEQARYSITLRTLKSSPGVKL